MLLRFEGGAKGVLMASQISTGEENGLTIRVYGTEGGLLWRQEQPSYLTLLDPSGYQKVISRGSALLCPAAQEAERLPAGHPEGFIETFANVYREAFKSIRGWREGQPVELHDHPTVEDGVIGNAFIDTVLASARSDTKWTGMLA